MASEVGVIEFPEEEVKLKGRLGPGDKIALDLETGKIYFSEEIVNQLVKNKKYKEWVEENITPFIPTKDVPEVERKDVLKELITFGYDKDEISMVVKEMALKGAEPTYSMGNDTPISVLSRRPKMLASYFKQRFCTGHKPTNRPNQRKAVMSLKHT